MKALFIGRFQPLHFGHTKVIEDIDRLSLECIIIGVGVNGKNRTFENPFYYSEIKEMLLPVIKSTSTPVEIYKIPDINNNKEYAYHVEKITGCNEEDTIIVSGNQRTVNCFTKYGRNYLILKPKRKLLDEGKYISATKIRNDMLQGEKWKEYVTNSTRMVIEKIDGIKIIKELGDLYDKQSV